MDVADLEAKLAQARKQYKDLWQTSTKTGQSGIIDVSDLDLDDWKAAREAVLSAERALALAQGEEAALACNWHPMWSGGAPLPHIVSSGRKTCLMYLVSEPDPNWDGTYVTVIDPEAEQSYPIALVEFVDCYIYKFGGPNDEVFEGLPWEGKGLDGYGAYLIANSQWLAEQMQINLVHYLYDPSGWASMKHFVLLFHDEMFECIAEGYKIEVINASFEHVLALATNRIFQRD